MSTLIRSNTFWTIQERVVYIINHLGIKSPKYVYLFVYRYTSYENVGNSKCFLQETRDIAADSRKDKVL